MPTTGESVEAGFDIASALIVWGLLAILTRVPRALAPWWLAPMRFYLLFLAILATLRVFGIHGLML